MRKLLDPLFNVSLTTLFLCGLDHWAHRDIRLWHNLVITVVAYSLMGVAMNMVRRWQ